MKKILSIVLPWTVILAFPVSAREDGKQFQPTPPPLSTLDFFKGTRQVTVTGIYMQLATGEKSGLTEKPTGAGIDIDVSRGYANGFGALVHMTGMGLSVPMKDPMTNEEKKYPAYAVGAGVKLVVDLIQGEKRDIAGEIIAKTPTLALFAGLDGTATFFKMDDFMDSGYDFSVETFDYGFPVGAAADIPLGFFLSLIPFGSYTWSQTMVRTTMPFTMPLYSPPYYKWIGGIPRESTSTTTRVDYGLDIDLRLFRNAPEWKISVGTVMSQISGMKDGNLVIMASIKKESGKYYSSTMFGPKLH